MSDIPFERTVCACAECVECCRVQPGCLTVGDAERIAEFLGEPAEPYLAASPGALVGRFEGGKLVTFRVGTIVPKPDVTGRCVFLTDEGRCRIHAVAPFGCAHFDVHMNRETSDARMTYGIHQQMRPEYVALRARLEPALSHNPRWRV